MITFEDKNGREISIDRSSSIPGRIEITHPDIFNGQTCQLLCLSAKDEYGQRVIFDDDDQVRILDAIHQLPLE